MRGTRYSEDAIRALVENYAVMSAKKDTTAQGLHHLVRVADLDRALERLPLEYWEVVLLHGMLGIPTRGVAALLHKSHAWVGKRFHHAIEELAYYMNGGE